SSRSDSLENVVMSSRLQEKHALMTRWTHWINFPLLAVMIWSGLLIYWANDVYRIGIGGWTLLHFFPDWVYETFNLKYHLAYGMYVHFFFMWLFALNGAIYTIFTIRSGAWKELSPTLQSPREAIAVMLYDLGLRKTLPPQTKYNSAQKIAYTGIVLLAFG